MLVRKRDSPIVVIVIVCPAKRVVCSDNSLNVRLNYSILYYYNMKHILCQLLIFFDKKRRRTGFPVRLFSRNLTLILHRLCFYAFSPEQQ